MLFGVKFPKAVFEFAGLSVAAAHAGRHTDSGPSADDLACFNRFSAVTASRIMAGLNAAGLILILKDGKPRQEVDLAVGQSLSMGK